MTEQELLKVLDMSEEEQWKWITEGDRVIEYFPDDEIFIGDPQKYLADLAFRLRAEAVNKNYSNWLHAGQIVYDHTKKEFPYRTPGYLTWFSVSAKPIHWIIAALIAKESK